jgi:hypothetical protein
VADRCFAHKIRSVLFGSTGRPKMRSVESNYSLLSERQCGTRRSIR